jgi:glycosyltransferase involved in cell wall biosynthesis
MAEQAEKVARPLVVIPAYNEAATIQGIVRKVREADFDVLVVDDGSADLTGRLALEAGAELLRNPVNQGKGAAIRCAVERALEEHRDPVIFIDADGQHRPEDLPAFMETYGRTGADLIIGTRMGNPRGMPLIRLAANTLSSIMISLLAGTRVTDSQSGYRLVSRRLLSSLKPTKTGGFELESEMIIDSVRDGFTYAEIPIDCIYGNERSHYRPLRDSSRFLRLALRKALQLASKKK